MSGWLRYFALNAQSRTGLSAAVLIWAITDKLWRIFASGKRSA